MTPAPEQADVRIATIEECIAIVHAAANGYGALAASAARTAIKELRALQERAIAEAVKS